MTNIITFKNFLFIVIISFFACKSSLSTDHDEAKTIETITSSIDSSPVKLISNQGVIFEYKFGKKTKYGENFLIEMECLVINTTKEDMLYLRQSDSGLDYYLVIKPDTHKVIPYRVGNATWPMISTLSTKDSLQFKTQILAFKNSDPIEKIGLDFRVADKFIPLDTLKKKSEWIDNIYRSETKLDNVIWGTQNDLLSTKLYY